MNARRAFVILGAISVVLITALVAVAVYFHRQMEVEKNQAKTGPARAKRWAEKQPESEKTNVESASAFEQEEKLTEQQGEGVETVV